MMELSAIMGPPEEGQQIAERISQPADLWKSLFPELKRLVVSTLDYRTLIAFSKASKDCRTLAAPFLFKSVDIQNRILTPVGSLQNFVKSPSSPVKIHHLIKNATILAMFGEDHIINSIVNSRPVNYDTDGQDKIPGAVFSTLSCLINLRTVKLDVSAVPSPKQNQLRVLLKGIKFPYVTQVSIQADVGVIGAFMNACSANKVTELDMPLPLPVNSIDRPQLYSEISKRQSDLTILRVVTEAPVTRKRPTMMQAREIKDIADRFPQVVRLHVDCGLGYGDKIYGPGGDEAHFHKSQNEWHKEFNAALEQLKRLTNVQELAISIIPKTWNRGSKWYYRPSKMLFREMPNLEKLFILEHWRKWYEIRRRRNTIVIRNYTGWTCEETFPDSSACNNVFLHFCTLYELPSEDK